MKAGTSIITEAAGCARSSSCSRPSWATLSASRTPAAGSAAASAASSSATGTAASGCAGKTVSRVAMTSRWRSISGA